MNRQMLIGITGIVLVAIGTILWVTLPSSEKVDFSTQIKPILNNKCISCHGGVKKNAGFSLLFEEEAFAATESGTPAILPGDASGSEFIRRLREKDPELRMPYQKPPLSDEEIELLTRWIDQGAEWGEHWAYSLPQKIDVPKTSQEAGLGSNTASTFIKNDIDPFILARMEEHQLVPSKPAETNTLARRVALDLTGLPPDQELFSAFTGGTLSYGGLVDSLLSRSSYGEKWASWWLDLARYADTKGYERDAGRSMWAYRDWVIRALNRDMPYDEFTIAQLAGDLLPDPSIDQLIATAFHRNTMNNDEGGTEDEEFRTASVIDRVNTTFEVWQSTTMGCVQCHSHPYDPFRHDEYYRLMAFFNNTRDEDTYNEDPNLYFFGDVEKAKIEKIKKWVTAYGDSTLLKQYSDFLRFKEPVYQAHLSEDFVNGELADTKWLALWDNGSCKLKNIDTQGATSMYLYYRSGIDGTTMTIKKGNAQGPILARFGIDKTQGNIIRRIPFKKVDEKVTLHIEANNNAIPRETSTSAITWFAFLPDLPGKGKPGYQEILSLFLEVMNVQVPTLPIMVENPDYMKRSTQVFERGNWLLKADTVQAKTPEVLNEWEAQWNKDRMGLAQWMVSKKNPLTARTLVNRVWHQLFGRGLVATLEDMGTQSDPPSHPALLDWLALRFMNDHGWSIKALIKDIVLSGTYRQSSESSPGLFQKDPGNQWYARAPRMRLSAEQIRDQALAISGLLSTKMYGPGVMPPQPEGVWQTVYSNEQWVESKGADKNRRAVYTYLKRTSPYPSFLTFDAGSREVCTVRRTVTNTPLQALVTLNDPVYLEAAYHFARTMQGKDVSQAISDGYKKALYSEITPGKLEALRQLFETSLLEFQNSDEAVTAFLPFEERPDATLAALTVVANAIMNLDEFLNKV
ncbi:DUF1553 domain-containing protein [Flavobacteriaceae bacterium TP-CH-4]|uniref:DUF1553 domain-containing protein n=1 Tax=Pelagihabitans pacificus TaxID=2696054 RepID=A0A967ECQ7_9FLAO|nr:PSD1 and planctomycete cytochrome C domain-containing protein [Pelagihabitans pacificus]NHF61441.1 DUF1553 domain-containing protein [Pelagihabitans pacificus]